MGESMQIQGQPGGCTKALVLKREIKPTSPSTTKPEEISKQVSSATCSLGPTVYLESQRAAGRSSDGRFCGGALCCSFAPASWEMLQRDRWEGLCSTAFYLVIPVTLSPVTESAKNQLH